MTQEYIDAPPAVNLGYLSQEVGSAPPVAKDVTYERILDARDGEPQNWITYYGAYDGQRYSKLDQINKDNVKKLSPAWVFQAGSQGLHAGPSTYAFEAAPLVVLATAHPAKFPDAVEAATGVAPEAPARLAALWDASTAVETVPPTIHALRKRIQGFGDRS